MIRFGDGAYEKLSSFRFVIKMGSSEWYWCPFKKKRKEEEEKDQEDEEEGETETKKTLGKHTAGS